MGNICFCSNLGQASVNDSQKSFCKKNTGEVFKNVSSHSSQAYALFEQLLISSTPFVSIFGTYKICVKGHKGSITLDRLAHQFVLLIKSNQNFNEDERKYGISISKIIFDIEASSLILYNKKNCIIKLISKIVQFIRSLCTYNQFWCERYDLTFNTYTSKQFIIKTGLHPKKYYGTNWRNYIHGNGSFENPRVWDLKENKRDICIEDTKLPR